MHCNIGWKNACLRLACNDSSINVTACLQTAGYTAGRQVIRIAYMTKGRFPLIPGMQLKEGYGKGRGAGRRYRGGGTLSH